MANDAKRRGRRPTPRRRRRWRPPASWGGWGPLPGPWLKPGFREKLFTDLQQNADLMRTIIDRFERVAAKFAAALTAL